MKRISISASGDAAGPGLRRGLPGRLERLAWLAGCLLFLCPVSALPVPASEEMPADQTIHSLRELRALSPGEAAAALPVDVVGVLTYVELPRDICIIQNEDGAAYVHFRTDGGKLAGRPNLQLEEGDRVRLRGVSAAGSFAPSIWHPDSGNIRVEKVGKAELPEPMRLFPTVILDPPLDSYRVEVTGVVTGVEERDSRMIVTFNDGFDDFDLLIAGPPNPEALPEDLVNARIRARGVFSPISDGRRNLIHARFFLPSAEAIKIVERGAESVFAKAPVGYESLTGYQAVTGERVHVEGTVTASLPPRRLYLRIEGGPLEVRTNRADLPAVGSRISVAGYRDLEDGILFLHTVAFRQGSASPQPEPLSLTSIFSLAEIRHGELVSVEARLEDSLATDRTSLLLFEDGLRSFTAELPEGLNGLSDTPAVGSWLRISGILLKTGDDESGAAGFRLQLRGPEDLEILRSPPFWTTPRIILLLAVLGLASGGFAVWSFWLRHKVREQARILAQKFESEKVQEERNRISRELHDTLEQDLVAIQMQLSLAEEQREANPEAGHLRLRTARRILERTRMESRHSIQDLREEELGSRDLAHALRRVADRFAMDSGYAVEVDLPPPAVLSWETQRNVLLILREAIHNALKHSKADHIVMRGRREDSQLIMEVEDNGSGFAHDGEGGPTGHFGLQGMRERARHFDAVLEIESSDGRGTRVRLTIPNVYPDSP